MRKEQLLPYLSYTQEKDKKFYTTTLNRLSGIQRHITIYVKPPDSKSVMQVLLYCVTLNVLVTIPTIFGNELILIMDTNSSNTDSSPVESTLAVKVIVAFVLCVIIVTAVVGNISIWIIILTTRALRTITNMFILGLSAADLLVSIANMPLTVVAIFTGEWPLSDFACVVFGYINMLTLVTSVMSLCNISINRYFMVCRPSKYQDIYTKRNAILMITGKETALPIIFVVPRISFI